MRKIIILAVLCAALPVLLCAQQPALEVPYWSDHWESYSTAGIYFGYQLAKLRKEDDTLLNRIAGWLKTHPDVKIIIAGHTDATKQTKSDQQLSLARADAVKKFLTEAGIAAGRMSTVGFGGTRPLPPSADPTVCQRNNNRIEFFRD